MEIDLDNLKASAFTSFLDTVIATLINKRQLNKQQNINTFDLHETDNKVVIHYFEWKKEQASTTSFVTNDYYLIKIDSKTNDRTIHFYIDKYLNNIEVSLVSYDHNDNSVTIASKNEDTILNIIQLLLESYLIKSDLLPKEFKNNLVRKLKHFLYIKKNVAIINQ